MYSLNMLGDAATDSRIAELRQQIESMEADLARIPTAYPVDRENLKQDITDRYAELNTLLAKQSVPVISPPISTTVPSPSQPTVPVVSPPITTTVQVPITESYPTGTIVPAVSPTTQPPQSWQPPAIFQEPVPVVSPPVTTTTQVPTESAQDNTWLYVGGAILAVLLLGQRRTA